MGVDVRQFRERESMAAGNAMSVLLDWMSQGRIRPVVGHQFAFGQFREAMAAAVTGGGGGKIILRIEDTSGIA